MHDQLQFQKPKSRDEELAVQFEQFEQLDVNVLVDNVLDFDSCSLELSALDQSCDIPAGTLRLSLLLLL